MYCGCGTKKNKSLWCIWLVLLALFIASWIIWPILGSRCVEQADENNCSTGTTRVTDSDGDVSYVGGYDNQCVYEISVCKTMAAFFYIGILFAILSTIPLFCMCCCSRPPQPKHQQAPVAHTAYGDQQTTYGDAYAGQPAAAYGQPAGTYNNGGGYANNTYGNTPYGGGDAYGKPQPGYGSAV